MTPITDTLGDKSRAIRLKQIREKSRTLRGGVFITCRATSEEKEALLDFMVHNNYKSQSDLIRAGLDALGCFDILMEEDD